MTVPQIEACWGKDFVGSDVYGVNTSLACCDVGHGTLWDSEVLRPSWNRNGIELFSRRVKDDHVIIFLTFIARPYRQTAFSAYFMVCSIEQALKSVKNIKMA